mmetsp:Transcript_27484/g.40598  ORF Transcript_27484/g.40598 Transcript_27484/m.40598 type:complete len:224 (-) Transcript_27484:95-766(-)|eukprot:CAMPEP_0194204434 /NCGR_PEP_ID=MMETSP0156-20130528/3953_1 /TAXON_ID=33649 /ORGANISM="Thalassionema nitzschioides, Strain L26-B" /LENGTH=223 /DNA_ID=CAMNT_0038930443 /DNA_START=61 /DNA_END=732 /DNA_ORIENTATION=+
MKYRALYPPSDYDFDQPGPAPPFTEEKTKDSKASKYHRQHDEYAELRALNNLYKKNYLAKFSAKSVQFDTVQILFYPRILGDNPCCVGAPLSLDWQPFHQEITRVEQYERFRQRRPKVSKLSRRERQEIVLSSGTTQQELDEVNAYLEPSRKIILANMSHFGTGLGNYQMKSRRQLNTKKTSTKEVFVDASKVDGGSWYGERNHIEITRRRRRKGAGEDEMDC